VNNRFSRNLQLQVQGVTGWLLGVDGELFRGRVEGDWVTTSDWDSLACGSVD